MTLDGGWELATQQHHITRRRLRATVPENSLAFDWLSVTVGLMPPARLDRVASGVTDDMRGGQQHVLRDWVRRPNPTEFVAVRRHEKLNDEVLLFHNDRSLFRWVAQLYGSLLRGRHFAPASASAE